MEELTLCLEVSKARPEGVAGLYGEELDENCDPWNGPQPCAQLQPSTVGSGFVYMGDSGGTMRSATCLVTANETRGRIFSHKSCQYAVSEHWSCPGLIVTLAETENGVVSYRVEVQTDSKKKWSWVTVTAITYPWLPLMRWPDNGAASTAPGLGRHPRFNLQRWDCHISCSSRKAELFSFSWTPGRTSHIATVFFISTYSYTIAFPLPNLEQCEARILPPQVSNLYRLMKWRSDCRDSWMLGSEGWTWPCRQQGNSGQYNLFGSGNLELIFHLSWASCVP